MLFLVLLSLVVLVDSAGQLIRTRLLEGADEAALDAAENASLCRPADG